MKYHLSFKSIALLTVVVLSLFCSVFVQCKAEANASVETRYAFILHAGFSMEPTISDGQQLKVALNAEIARNDIVVCRYPNRGLSLFVKRVVAVTGDQVYRKNGVTHVIFQIDGSIKDEALDERLATLYPYGSPDDYEVYTLGVDEYFVVGDNRYNSHDSRDWNDSDPENVVGPISYDLIYGKVVGKVVEIGD